MKDYRLDGIDNNVSNTSHRDRSGTSESETLVIRISTDKSVV
jgi:hypothetical protein